MTTQVRTRDRIYVGLAMVLAGVAAGVGIFAGGQVMAVQDGPVHDGTVQSGAVQSGTVQSGAVQDGPVHDGPVHDGTVHDGTVQSGAVQSGAVQSGAVPHDTSSGAAPGQAVAQTRFPGLVSASGEAPVDSMPGLHPLAGSILEAPGPFDDRFDFEALAFDGATVSGAVRVTSDVSELIDLEVVAGFYDSSGVLLGTGRFVHHLGDEDHAAEGVPDETQAFEVALPEGLSGAVSSVAVGVPVLVNE